MPMTKGKSIHVVPSPAGGWSVRKSGSERASRKFGTKEEAVDWGRAHSIDKGAELFIHRTDGTIQEKASYATEPVFSRNIHVDVGANGGGRG
jgi:hypothetical protein